MVEMHEYLAWLYSWLKEEAIALIHKSHDYFWNGNSFFFVVFVIAMTMVLFSKSERTSTKKPLAVFSLIALIGICYNPFLYLVVMKIPGFNEAVYSRIWVILPAWIVIALALADINDKFKKPFIQNSLYILLASGLVIAGSSLSFVGMFIDIDNPYKVKDEGIEIAKKIESIEGNNPVGLLIYTNPQNGLEDNYIPGGTISSAVEQYSGDIFVVPIYVDEQAWQNYYTSDYLPDGETVTIDKLDDELESYRRAIDFSYVVFPHDEDLEEKMLYAGYQCIATIGDNDLYQAVPRWCIQSYSIDMENYKKVYVLSDNMGHFIVIDGGSKSDRRQLQQILNVCGTHVDAWIFTNPSADNLEGFNYIITTAGYTVDKVFIPAINIDSLPDGFMIGRDLDIYEDFLDLSEAGLFEISYLQEGDELNLYGIDFKILSDFLDVQSGSIVDNSMLFRIEAADNSCLFCSYIGFEQGQIAIQTYGDELESDYVQIASGSGDGLGLDFYRVVNPQVAFCDSIRDDAGRKTYNQLVSVGIQCYCLENGDQIKVMFE